MYKRIILPTDGSEISKKAISHAVRVADPEDSEIIVVNVMDSKHLTSLPENALEDGSIEFEDYGESITKDFLKIINEKYPEYHGNVRTVVAEGKPAPVILNAADKLNAEIIVITSSGKHIADRFLLGSVTENLSRHSKIPVMVVPGKKR